jgi:N-methylhydantoinase B
MSKPRDPIGFELFKNTLLSIADEMLLTILRTAYSGVLKDNMDYSTAFCDGSGRTIAQGLTLPAHLSSFPDALAATIARFGDRMQPGDVYCLNDPFEGGMHIPDVYLRAKDAHAEVRRQRRTLFERVDVIALPSNLAGALRHGLSAIDISGVRIPCARLCRPTTPSPT